MTSPYINGWKGLSEYLGGMAIQTLRNYEEANIIKRHKLGRRVLFKKEEIDNAIKLVEK